MDKGYLIKLVKPRIIRHKNGDITTICRSLVSVEAKNVGEIHDIRTHVNGVTVDTVCILVGKSKTYQLDVDGTVKKYRAVKLAAQALANLS